MNIQDLTKRSEEASQLLALLANAHRLRILCELHQGERSVSALEEVVELSQSAVSQHLAKLRSAGIVATRRDAQTIYYSISDARTATLLSTLYDMFCTPKSAPRATRRKS